LQGMTRTAGMQVDRPEDFDKPGAPPRTVEWNDKHYLLCLITPECVDDQGQPWALEGVSDVAMTRASAASGFSSTPTADILFSDLTTRWKPNNGEKYQLAIVLDGKIISAPNILGPITGGSGYHSGGERDFPTPNLPISDQHAQRGQPSGAAGRRADQRAARRSALGADNLRKGLTACGFGLVVVGVFLVGYYYLAGHRGVLRGDAEPDHHPGRLAAFGATFTLPCIAGIVLSVGTAVDANVLIFERLREEQHRGLGCAWRCATATTGRSAPSSTPT
jgi:SecD/SecF fusion protein